MFRWFLPTGGDGPPTEWQRPRVGIGTFGLGSARHDDEVSGERDASLKYLIQLARAADSLGYEAVLTPTGAHCEDAWVVTAALIAQTERLKFLVAFRPGLVAPALTAHMASTFQRLSGGRLLLNIVAGSSDAELRTYGDAAGHDERYARTGEFSRCRT